MPPNFFLIAIIMLVMMMMTRSGTNSESPQNLIKISAFFQPSRTWEFNLELQCRRRIQRGTSFLSVNQKGGPQKMPFLIQNLEALHHSFLNALKSKRKGDGHLFYFLPMAATFDRIVCFTPKKKFWRESHQSFVKLPVKVYFFSYCDADIFQTLRVGCKQ